MLLCRLGLRAVQFESSAQSAEIISDCYPFLEGGCVSRRTVRCPMPKREKRNELVRVAFSRFQICPDIEADVNLASSL